MKLGQLLVGKTATHRMISGSPPKSSPHDAAIFRPQLRATVSNTKTSVSRSTEKRNRRRRSDWPNQLPCFHPPWHHDKSLSVSLKYAIYVSLVRHILSIFFLINIKKFLLLKSSYLLNSKKASCTCCPLFALVSIYEML